ncbi:peptide chain release factor N(5)-glutamine methyltransferase [Saccharospirillum mangrovi]|uniref:peptide chain release factor N(5)-glutamine methyltransferase n=1 Tax=Saccharospirillum mangrovi TaxID=2161747 RepID=UPI000D3A1C07|nr:peptide chain release factor N(5)-glutamine methyltransferase [Saccharospirillum mangrovi]
MTDHTNSVKAVRQSAIERGLDALDADLLLARALGQTRTWLFTWPDKTVEPGPLATFAALAERRLAGEPVAHILGEKEFWSLPLAVNASTLVPRPDTETLVAAVLDRFGPAPIDLADLGTGTGAIALALASERPNWRITAIDRIADAVALAKHNAEQLGLPVTVVDGDWAAPLADSRLDVLVSNPPYIDAADPHLAQGDVRFEPRSALVADDQGLADLRRIVGEGRRVLKSGGWVFLEHGWQQGAAVRRLLKEAGYHQIKTLHDLADRERVSLGRWD